MRTQELDVDALRPHHDTILYFVGPSSFREGIRRSSRTRAGLVGDRAFLFTNGLVQLRIGVPKNVVTASGGPMITGSCE